MYLTTRALVLRATDYNDRDRLLTLLTPDHGKLTAKARGLRRKNSPLTAPCQLLAYGEYTLFEYRGMYTINEASSIELFKGLHRDLIKFSLGSYFSQVAEFVSQEELPNPELLSLTLNCLHALNKLDLPPSMIKSVFELRCAAIAGFAPDLFGCHVCGSQAPSVLDLSGGTVLCEKCQHTASGLRMPLDPAMLEAMRYIVYCDPKKLFGFTLSPEGLQRLSGCTEAYLTTQLEHGFSTLDLYRSLLI